MTECILIRRQGRKIIGHEIGDRTIWKQHRDRRKGEEREEVDNISFYLVTRVDRDSVNYPPPQTRMQPQ